MKDILYKDPDEILNTFKLRKTAIRKLVLQCFLDYDFALSQRFLESIIQNESDRVTIYRTLNSFLQNGIIHKILDDEGGVKYALCKDTCTINAHDHRHVHFKCRVCGHTICIDAVHVPKLNIPGNFEVHDVNLLVSGICEECLLQN